MYDKARELNLPASFVELRHEAIHGELPSVIVLRQAAQKALDWLQTNYWKHLNDEGNQTGSDLSPSGQRYTSRKADLRNILQDYSESLQALADPERDRDTDKESRTTFEPILKILEDSNGGKQASAEFIDVLLDCWMLYTSSEDSTAVMPDASRDRPRLEDSTYAMNIYWEPLLNFLALKRPYLLEMLSDVIIKRLTDPLTAAPSVETFQASIFTLLNRIYTVPGWHKAYDQSRLNGVEMVSKCLQSPNRWTVRLAASISECPRHIRAKRMFGKRISQSMESLEVGTVQQKIDLISERSSREYRPISIYG
ncbi:MAG: hypothetical protein Q9172_000150 [Xanthocarpia lactea]